MGGFGGPSILSRGGAGGGRSGGRPVSFRPYAGVNAGYFSGLTGFGDTKESDNSGWLADFGAMANGTTYRIYPYNNELYIGGQFDIIGGIATHMLARYNGTNWYGYPNLATPGGSDGIDAVKYYNGELYVGGLFYS